VRILIEGRPGSGKTTAARRVVLLLTEQGARVTGFTTAEIRNNRSRVGFSIETVDGRTGVLAHVDFDGPRVGKYGVDLSSFEDLALPALQAASDQTIVVVDELGKMELLSTPFRRTIETLFDGGNSLVATVQLYKHPFTDNLKLRSDTKVFKLSRANRDKLPRLIASRMLSD
jgi:nucleoside-triphosphatase